MPDFEYTLAEAIDPPLIAKKTFLDQVIVYARLSDRRILAVELVNAETEKPFTMTTENILPEMYMAQASVNVVMAVMEQNLDSSGNFILPEEVRP